MKNIRAYRKDINKSQFAWYFGAEEQRARVYAPTGSGKTEMFIDLIREVFDRNTAKTGPRILIAHPRLALSTDQQKRFAKAFKGTELEFTSFHSGEVVKKTRRMRNNNATTSVSELEERRNTTTTPHITFTSYKSLSRVASLDYDLIICDEAHYLIEKQYRKNLYKFQGKTIFFTATPVAIEADGEHTMSNEELYGKLIADPKPVDLIKKGYILAPRLRSLKMVATKDANGEDILVDPVETIAYAFTDQREQINPKLKHKMMVAMANTLQFDDIMDELDRIRELTKSDVDVYYIKAGEVCKNGNKSEFESRAALIKDFDKNKGECIIIHCDTIAEGIDIDTIIGLTVLRNLSKRKFIQSMGRCSRPYKGDMKDGEVKNIDKRLKPNSIITIPSVNGKMYCEDGKLFATVFTELGYDDIMEYIDADCDPYQGGKDGKDGEDGDVMFGAVLDYRVAEMATTFEALFDLELAKLNHQRAVALATA